MAGRPTKYKSEYADLARKFCLLGATDESLAEFFEVNESTIHQWKVDYPEFSESIKEGKFKSDAMVADRLFTRACGYTTEELRIEQGDEEKASKTVTVRKEVAPDTTAAIFWLKNRQKAYWRDKQDVEHSGTVSYEQMTDEQLDARIKRLQEANGLPSED